MQNPVQLKDVPSDKQTVSMCCATIWQDPGEFKFVLDKSEEVCAAALMAEKKTNKKLAERDVAQRIVQQTDFLKGVAFACESAEEGPSFLKYMHGDQELYHVIASILRRGMVEEDEVLAKWFGHPFLYEVEYNSATEAWIKKGKATRASDSWPCIRMKSSLLQYVKRSRQTQEMCVYAVADDPSLIRFVAEQTPFLVGLALGSDPVSTLRYASQQTGMLCRLAFGLEPKSLRHVKKENLTDAFTDLVFASYGKQKTLDGNGNVRNWHELPGEVIPLVALDAAVAKNMASTGRIDNIPKTFLDQGAYESAVERDPNNLKHVPPEFVTKAMCEEAVKKDATLLQVVPKHERTMEMCIGALEKDPSTQKFWPEKFLHFANRLEQAKKKQRKE